MDEDQYVSYCEWAESELIWGKGMYNWRREFEYPPMNFEGFDDELEIPY